MTGHQFDQQFAYLLQLKKVLLDGLEGLGVGRDSYNLDSSLNLAFKTAEANRPDCKIVDIKDYRNPCREFGVQE